MKKWSLVRNFGEYSLIKGEKIIKIGYLKKLRYSDVAQLVKQLNDNAYEDFAVSFYLTDYGLSQNKTLFSSVFYGYETEDDEDNRLNVFGLEEPIANYIGGLKKYVKKYHIEEKDNVFN